MYIVLSLVSLIGLTGCDLAKNYTKVDREGNLEAQDYRDAFAPREAEVDEAAAADDSIPPLMPYVAGLSDNLKPMPLVSVNLNQSVPLRDALFELAKEAEYDLELDPNIRGSIIFTARNKPLDVVVDRIADVAGLRYQFVDDTLRIELDSPYSKTYKIDFLNVIRNSDSEITNSISVVSGDGADTGSKFKANTSSEGDFWAELEANISQILNVQGSYMRTTRDPRLNVTDPKPVPVEQAGASEGGKASSAQGGAGAPSANGQQPSAEPPQAVLQVDSLPLDEEDSSRKKGRSSSTKEEPEISFSINKQAGIILVYAPDKLQKQVQKYLDLVRKTVTSQVLIEAKVLEVSLTDEFATGISWGDINLLGDGVLNFQSGTAAGGFITGMRPSLNPVTNPTTDLSIGVIGNDAQALMEAVSRFGTVKALASPRLTVLNNQPAVLNVATNVVYFELEINITDGTTTTAQRTEIQSDIKTVPEGILINVMPSIDLETGMISMSVRPTVTSVEDFVDDPGFAFAASTVGSNLSNRVPQVNVQEIDSVINMASGQAIVMGGLMQDRSESSQSGIPMLSEIPLAGNLFKNQGDKISKKELVIFLKATILDSGSNVHDTDKDFYKMFSNDRRPFKM
ncbi:MAG: type II and III secretion system family protein [Rhodospirillales bacterium]|nr:type II and III secretion system family protein [Rhodospirillales bacterium]